MQDMTSDEDLKARIKAIRSISFGASKDEIQRQIDQAIARNVLHEKLGYFKSKSFSSYDLDDETRDSLIAHGRQDAAHALIASSRAVTKLAGLRTRVSFLTILSVLQTGLLLWMIFGRQLIAF